MPRMAGDVRELPKQMDWVDDQTRRFEKFWREIKIQRRAGAAPS